MEKEIGIFEDSHGAVKNVLTVSAILILLLSSIGCDKMKKVDKMSDTTTEMADTTKNMAKTTSDMSETTKGMAETTSDMSKTTKDMQKTTEGMSNTTTEMNEQMKNAIQMGRAGAHQVRTDCVRMAVDAKSFEEKVKYAGCFMRAMEYQFWTNTGYDTEKRRDELLATSADEFFFTLQSYNQRGMFDSQIAGDMGNYLFAFLLNQQLPLVGNLPMPFNTNLKNIDELMFFYAIGAALHYEDPLQKHSLELRPVDGKTLEVLTMDKIIYKSLEYDQMLNANKIRFDDIPEYARKVLGWKRLALQLLKARVSTLASTAMIYLSRIPYMPQSQGAYFLLGLTESVQRLKSFGRGKNYVLNFDSPTYGVDQMGTGEIEMYADWMRMAVETQKQLMRFGHSAAFNSISKNLILRYGTNYTARTKTKLVLTNRDLAIVKLEKYLEEMKSLVFAPAK